jgi:hypothetical protein
MFGYDLVAVLPILLVLAAFGGLIAILLTVYTEAISKSCPICGVEFIGTRDLKKHIKDHDKGTSSKRFVSKKRDL